MPILNTIFLWLRTRQRTGHPAEHGIDFDVVMARRAHANAELPSRFPVSPGLKPGGKGAPK